MTSYSTTFSLTENPISEGGKWTHLNPYFNTVQTASGNVYGNHPQFANPGLYEDSYAILTGAGTFNPNQRVEATVRKGTTGGYMEIELWLRASDSYNAGTGFGTTRCYECFLHQNGEYAALAQWAGTNLNSAATIAYFDVFDLGPGANNVQAPQDGDTFFAQIVGTTITCGIVHSGVTTIYYTQDVSAGGRTVITSGNPGMGFDAGGSGGETAQSNFGFKDYAAYSL
jgi:hypothetical protein